MHIFKMTKCLIELFEVELCLKYKTNTWKLNWPWKNPKNYHKHMAWFKKTSQNNTTQEKYFFDPCLNPDPRINALNIFFSLVFILLVRNDSFFWWVMKLVSPLLHSVLKVGKYLAQNFVGKIIWLRSQGVKEF